MFQKLFWNFEKMGISSFLKSNIENVSFGITLIRLNIFLDLQVISFYNKYYNGTLILLL